MASGAASAFAGLLVALSVAGRGAGAGADEWVVGELGGEVTLTCQNASWQAVQVDWFEGEPGTIPILLSSEGKFPSDTRFSLLENGSLHISGLRLEDEGNYTCKETLNKISSLHRIQLFVASGPEKVDVSISPTMALPNGTLYAKRHDILNFTCTSDSWPEPTTEWDFNQSSSLQELFTEVNDTLGYFVLHNISPRYQGNYSCLATNWLSGRQQIVTRELLVYYAPPSLPQCWAQTPTEGSGGVQLFCSWPGGYPHPTLQWTDPEKLNWTLNMTDRGDTTVVTLNHTQLLHGKTFVCHGSHILNQEKQACTIQLERPSVMSDPLRSCFTGGTAILTCQSTAGNPPGQITWLRNASQPKATIHSGGRFLISQKGNVSTLVIQNCSHGTDQGYYICKVENPLGLKEVYLQLTVTRPVNIAGIVGAIVVLLLVAVLIFSGIILFAGPHLGPKGNMLRNRDGSDILVLMDSEEEDQPMETTEEPALYQTVPNGSPPKSSENPLAKESAEILLHEIKRDAEYTA
nr:PREDICTED: V-set and immunoglobulin domain-containing protein 10 [Anolis carolinensis]|eukprot:XP_008111936.1 PREDICTED: V-set and immunoglobulin domain-containing protein 10 [Anolis carolinensis]